MTDNYGKLLLCLSILALCLLFSLVFIDDAKYGYTIVVLAMVSFVIILFVAYFTQKFPSTDYIENENAEYRNEISIKIISSMGEVWTFRKGASIVVMDNYDNIEGRILLLWPTKDSALRNKPDKDALLTKIDIVDFFAYILPLYAEDEFQLCFYYKCNTDTLRVYDCSTLLFEPLLRKALLSKENAVKYQEIISNSNYQSHDFNSNIEHYLVG